MSININPSALYLVEGQQFLGEQLAIALKVCLGIARTYAIADEANGGEGRSIDWNSLDEVAADADRALGSHMAQVKAWARRENGFIIVPADEDDDDDAGTAELMTLLTGKVWSAEEARCTRAMIETIQAARKKSDDTEGGACD